MKFAFPVILTVSCLGCLFPLRLLADEVRGSGAPEIQTTEILARQALATDNRPAADSFFADLQQWSLMLRNAQPNLVQWVVSHAAWRTCFNCLLEDWDNHPDQPRRLIEIGALVQPQRTTREEMVEAAKGVARWETLHGGIKAVLSELPPSTLEASGISPFPMKPLPCRITPVSPPSSCPPVWPPAL